MDPEDKNRETQLDSYEDRFSKLKSESDRLSYQLKKTEEENYAKTLQIASQRQLIESLQDKLADPKQAKPTPAPKPDESQDLQNKIKDLTSRCQILEQINEETVKSTQKDIEIWKSEAESARKQMRKVEEELYLSKKKVLELAEFEEKFKILVVEKEKLLISLENLKKTNKELEEKVNSHKEQFMRLTEVVQNDTSGVELKRVGGELEETKSKYEALVKELQSRVENLRKVQKELEQERIEGNRKLEGANRKTQELEALILQRDETLANKEKVLAEKDAKILKTQQDSEELYKSHIISFKVNLLISESPKTPEVPQQDFSTQVRIWEEKYNTLTLQNQKYEDDLKSLEIFLLDSQSKCQHQETKLKSSKDLQKKLKKAIQDLSTQLATCQHTLEEKDFSFKTLQHELESYKSQLSYLQDDNSSYSSLISHLTSEKQALESQSKTKDSKLKTLTSKLQFLETQLQEKNKEVLIKENELINADRQIEILKKKINSSHSRIKQIASEQIDSQKKKLESYESEIKMLKDMLKSVQSELKYKQQEVLKLKKPSPRKKELFEESPLQLIKGKIHAQEPEHKFFVEPIKESPFKKHSLNIFKAKSPFRVNSKKTLAQEEAPSLLRHIVKGYLTSYVLCEREKKEMMKIFSDLDQGRRGILDKSIVLEKCEDAMFDTSLLGNYVKDVDYKDFLEVNYHNQLQQIHRDLDINFSQILPGSISVSELRLMKQGLRPLHRQIWDVIVDRIGNEYPKEVDLFVVKQVLAQAQISL